MVDDGGCSDNVAVDDDVIVEAEDVVCGVGAFVEDATGVVSASETTVVRSVMLYKVDG